MNKQAPKCIEKERSTHDRKEEVKPILEERPPLERGGVIARVEDYWLITTG